MRHPVRLFVRVAADQDYRAAYPDWKPRLYDLVGAVSARYDEEFGIRFNGLGIEAWDRPEGLDSYQRILVHAEKNLNRRSSQILILMTGKDEDERRTDRWIDVGAAPSAGFASFVLDRPDRIGGSRPKGLESDREHRDRKP